MWILFASAKENLIEISHVRYTFRGVLYLYPVICDGYVMNNNMNIMILSQAVLTYILCRESHVAHTNMSIIHKLAYEVLPHVCLAWAFCATPDP